MNFEQEAASKTIVRVLEQAREKLLDTGTRNRLVHVNRDNQRSNTLNIVNELSDEVFRQLHNEGRRMRFKALGRDKEADEDELLFGDEDEDANGVSEDRQTDQFLETPLSESRTGTSRESRRGFTTKRIAASVLWI
jgi:hypothetical protein